MLTQLIIDSLNDWCKKAFAGILLPATSESSLRFGKALNLVDRQYPFGGQLAIAKIQTNGEFIEVQSWCKRYSYGREVFCPFENSKNSRLHLPLADPESFQKAMEELFQISFDYCRWLYRKAIKERRKHLKPLINEMAGWLRQERKKCQETDYQLDNKELLIIS